MQSISNNLSYYLISCDDSLNLEQTSKILYSKNVKEVVGLFLKFEDETSYTIQLNGKAKIEKEITDKFFDVLKSEYNDDEEIENMIECFLIVDVKEHETNIFEIVDALNYKIENISKSSDDQVMFVYCYYEKI